MALPCWCCVRPSLGTRGERLAARWLARRGYRILQRNIRSGRLEADLVALTPTGDTIVIVEVKTRRGGAGPPPESAVDRRKRRNLLRLGARRRHQWRSDGHGLRFDVIAIDWPANGSPRVRHYPCAFQTPW